MTLKDQRHWLKTRQRWAHKVLADAEVMVIGQVMIDHAREDLAATTAL